MLEALDSPLELGHFIRYAPISLIHSLLEERHGLLKEYISLSGRLFKHFPVKSEEYLLGFGQIALFQRSLSIRGQEVVHQSLMEDLGELVQ